MQGQQNIKISNKYFAMQRKVGFNATAQSLEKNRNVRWLGVPTAVLRELVKLSYTKRLVIGNATAHYAFFR